MTELIAYFSLVNGFHLKSFSNLNFIASNWYKMAIFSTLGQAINFIKFNCTILHLILIVGKNKKIPYGSGGGAYMEIM